MILKRLFSNLKSDYRKEGNNTSLNREGSSISLNDENIEGLIGEKRLLINGPKIVVIGGGTGLSTMLRGLKYYTSNITAIVTVGDDGGGSGDLREDLGILPPGDIRNCILALADTEPLMEELLQYRFQDGKLKNQSFGNLFLAAMNGISDNFEDAVQKMSSVLAVTGKVLPVTLEDMKLIALLENGSIVEGESQIPNEAIKQKSKIKELMIEPKEADALEDAIIAIKEADAIILGPGSLYTSIVPNLLIKGISESIAKSEAMKIYISNIMTQPGETDNFNVSNHIEILEKYGGKEIVDYVIANNSDIPKDVKKRYSQDNSRLVLLDRQKIKKLNININIIEDSLFKINNGYVKHDSELLAEVIFKTILNRKLLCDEKRILEYMYLSKRIRSKSILR